MLEHLMFRGTRDVPDGEFDRRMDDLSAEINAATWTDFTCYTALAPPESSRHILQLEQDRFANLALTPEVFRAERDVVANERREMVESDPDALLDEALRGHAFAESPYRHPTIGWGQDIAAYEREDALAFYRDRYAPQNLCVATAGPRPFEQVVEDVAATLGLLPAGSTSVADVGPTQWGESGEWELRLPLAATRVTQAFAAPPRASRGHLVCRLIGRVLTTGRSSRLYRRLVQSGDAVYVSAGPDPFRDACLFTIDAALHPGVDAEAARRRMTQSLRELADGHIKADELRATSLRALADDVFALGTSEIRAEWLGESWITHDDPTGLLIDAATYETVSVDDIAAAARALLDGPSWAVTGIPGDP